MKMIHPWALIAIAANAKMEMEAATEKGVYSGWRYWAGRYDSCVMIYQRHLLLELEIDLENQKELDEAWFKLANREEQQLHAA